MDNFYKKIVFEKINKIHEFSENILKSSYNFCKDDDPQISSINSVINNKAYAIKCLTEELSGILKN